MSSENQVVVSQLCVCIEVIVEGDVPPLSDAELPNIDFDEQAQQLTA